LQEKFGQEMERRYGVGYDWRYAPIDGAAMHYCWWQKGSRTVRYLLFLLSVLIFHLNTFYIF
jgi:hypothetical protein